jgi:hypothetical protein
MDSVTTGVEGLRVGDPDNPDFAESPSIYVFVSIHWAKRWRLASLGGSRPNQSITNTILGTDLSQWRSPVAPPITISRE